MKPDSLLNPQYSLLTGANSIVGEGRGPGAETFMPRLFRCSGPLLSFSSWASPLRCSGSLRLGFVLGLGFRV